MQFYSESKVVCMIPKEKMLRHRVILHFILYMIKNHMVVLSAAGPSVRDTA